MKKLLLTLLSVLLLLSLTACNNKDQSNEEAVEEKNGLFDEVLSAKTDIYYSSGKDNNWSYENFRKEFSSGESCYVRINSKIISNKKIGNSDKVKAIYKFTGVNNCDVEITDGNATLEKSSDSNVTEYSLVIKSDKANNFDDKDVREITVVFKYTPKGDGNIVLDVVYEGNIDESYNKMSKIFFNKEIDNVAIETDIENTEEQDIENVDESQTTNFEYQVEDEELEEPTENDEKPSES